MIKNILFDMDGVLIDSEEAIRASCIRMFGELGVEASHDDFIPFTGMGENRFIGGVAEKYGVPFTPEMKARAYSFYGDVAPDTVVIYDGIPELVRELRAKGYKLAVASSADSIKVGINLRCMGLSEKDFDAVVTGSDVTAHKPDPEVFLTAAERIGADLTETVVIEDAVAGCRAAVAAKMRCIGVTTSFAASDLTAAGATYTVEKTPDIVPLLEKM